MAYDLLIKNGRIIDDSGMPSFCGDVVSSAMPYRLARWGCRCRATVGTMIHRER
jgi:hypothetical protein